MVQTGIRWFMYSLFILTQSLAAVLTDVAVTERRACVYSHLYIFGFYFPLL